MSDLQRKVIGFRGWKVSRDDGGLVLESTGVDGRWEPGPNEAKCQVEDNPRGGAGWVTLGWQTAQGSPWYERFHQAPNPDCVCGLYAMHKQPDVARWAGGDRVEGVVQAWGNIEVHADGFRAQYAEIVLLVMPDEVAEKHPYAAELLRECAARYGARIVSPGQLAFAAAEYGHPVPDYLRPEKPKPQEGWQTENVSTTFNSPIVNYTTTGNVLISWGDVDDITPTEDKAPLRKHLAKTFDRYEDWVFDLPGPLSFGMFMATVFAVPALITAAGLGISAVVA